jgi:hypothetical protein
MAWLAGASWFTKDALATGWRDGAFFVGVKRSSPVRDAHVVSRQIRNGGRSLSWQIFNLCTFENVGRSLSDRLRIGMIDAVGVSDQCVGQPGEIDKPMPVRIVASEARPLKPKNKPDVGECDLSGGAHKAGARHRAGARETEVLIDDDDAFIRLAELASFGGECILPLRRFAIVLDLRRARLTQIDNCTASARLEINHAVDRPPIRAVLLLPMGSC